MPRPSVALKSIVSFLAVIQSISAQTPGHEAHVAHNHALVMTPSGKTMLPGGIDGAVTPDLIPDSVAYSLFFSALAEPANATPEQTRRERGKLGRAQLSEADLLALMPILADFQQRQQAMEHSFHSAPVTGATVTLDSLRAALVSATRASMAGSVSAEGLSRLDALIQAEKRRMTIFPYPKMP